MLVSREYLEEYKIEPKVKVPIILTKPINADYGQSFGQNFIWNGKNFYEQWGLKGHNGMDYPAPIGTAIVAPCDGYVDNYIENNTYGNTLWFYSGAWEYNNEMYRLEMVFAHLEKKFINNRNVDRGMKIGISGNSGYPVTSTGPHLHWGVRIQKKVSTDWQLIDTDNGYRGYFNQYLITQDMYKLRKEKDSPDVYMIDEVNKLKHKICNEPSLEEAIRRGLVMDDLEEVSTLSTYKNGVELMCTRMDK